MKLLDDLKRRARDLEAEIYALYLAARHPKTPWYAKLLVAAIVAYAISPIDLIPDFIPVLGYVDDLVLLPIGIVLAIRMIPAPVLAECRQRAREHMPGSKPVSRIAAAFFVVIWIALTALAALWAYEAFAELPSRPGLNTAFPMEKP